MKKQTSNYWIFVYAKRRSQDQRNFEVFHRSDMLQWRSIFHFFRLFQYKLRRYAKTKNKPKLFRAGGSKSLPIASLFTLRSETKTRRVFESLHRPEGNALDNVLIAWKITNIECLAVYAKRWNQPQRNF